MVDPPGEGIVVNPMSWFATPGPFELEIGSGKGGFLLDRARANPHIRFLGIEWANKYYRYSADRMSRWNVSNVRIMRTDAKRFVLHHLPPDCVSVLHLYHPDPWPKKRHHKRRLVQPDFVKATVNALMPGGQWRIQTDHQEYFRHIRQLLDPCSELVAIPWEDQLGVSVDGWAGTNFEIKYVREGRRIFRVAYALSGRQARRL